jgi:hypothetical protein
MKHRTTSLLAAFLFCLAIVVPTTSVSADSGVPFPTRECTHPTVGFPTCYVRQADGMWARQEMADIDATWLTVGVVTRDEVVAAVGELNATAP